MAILNIRFSKQIKESELVIGTYNKSKKAQYDMYKYCYNYFKQNYRGIFFVIDEDSANEIFQNSFIKLWENIESKKIQVKDGILMGKDGKPLKGCLLTYFMGIAKFKYLEFVRENPIKPNLDSLLNKENEYSKNELISIMYGHTDNIQLDIISDLLSKMSERCREILTKFYYEEKNLDRILIEIPSITTKEALKTRKHKCLTTLKETANSIYKNYLNY